MTWLRFVNYSPNTSSASARPWTSRSLASLLICASAVLVLLPSCGPGVRHVSLSHPTLRVQGETEQTHDGLTIAVEPLTYENIERYPDVYRTFTLETARGTAEARGPIVPLPSFRITVTNHTGHVVRFTQSVIRLNDNLSNQYEVIPTSGELDAWEQQLNAATIATYPSFGTQLTTAVSGLRVFSRNVELLDGDSTTYYLVFRLPLEGDADDASRSYRALLERIERFTLRIAEVPVEMGEAGQVARTTEFQFDFDRSEYPQSAACRGGGEPSWAICRME